MTPEQKTALAYPCFLAAETLHPRFTHGIAGASLILTINAGYE